MKYFLHSHLLSSVDISSMFYSVQVDSASSKYLGFYSPFDDQIFVFKRLIMGLANVPWMAVAALRMLFTEENWQKFKQSKGNPDCAEGLSVECILIYYIDDILIYTKKNKGYKLHLFVLEFIFHQLNVYGFILDKNKIKILAKNITFSGSNLIMRDIATSRLTNARR